MAMHINRIVTSTLSNSSKCIIPIILRFKVLHITFCKMEDIFTYSNNDVHLWVFGFPHKRPEKRHVFLDLFGSGSGNLKSQNLKSVPPCACFHGFFSRVLGFPVTMLHTLLGTYILPTLCMHT